MILQSTPGRIVNKRVRKGGRYKIVSWFKFDSKGFAEIDESKISAVDLNKLKLKFKVVVPKKELKALKQTATVSEIPKDYKELQKHYTEVTGKKAFGVSKKNMIKELEVL